MKHIDVHYHFVRDMVEDDKIILKKIDTNLNLLNMLTQSVTREKFNWFKNSLGLEAY